ncbi:MAG: restriction endonuclease [Patescibacteria group bacterium]
MRNKRAWHPDFIKYMKFIVIHPNYSDMPNKFKSNGAIWWVSPSDEVRAKWWDAKKLELHCSNRAEVARKIHPKELHGLKPCQICGKEISIFYVYPNKITLAKLNLITAKVNFSPYEEDIDNIINTLVLNLGDDAFEPLARIFHIPANISTSKEDYISYVKGNCTGQLSPGVMSNPPDRLDGFHTYNACHRKEEDTGRHSGNLARYTQDRRAYENWADGDWNYTNRLMGEFHKCEVKVKCLNCGNVRRMTPDHIGPISLGFTHRPMFNPLCDECNSGKNNRMTLQDVKTLIKHEKHGEQVVSWHSKYIWDLFKDEVKTQEDAWKLSKIMRANLHYILIILSKISESGHDEFLLRYLHPEYSFYDYRFVSFDPIDGPGDVLKKPFDSKNKKKNADRYIRISFESLTDYMDKENRNSKIWNSPSIDKKMIQLLVTLNKKEYSGADTELKLLLKQLAIEASSTLV